MSGATVPSRLFFVHTFEAVGRCSVGELQSALDALAAEDLTGLFGLQLLERLGPLLVLQNRVAAEVTRTVRECELTGAAESDGLKTMPSWLRGHGHLTPAEAARLGGAGRAV